MAEESLESTTSQHDENTFEPTPTPATTHRDMFKVDEESCTFGQLLAKGEYRPKSNFIMELDTYVEVGPGTEAGYFVWVTRRSDRERKFCYYSMDSLQCKQRFLTEIRTTFGHGGLNTSFVERELSDFHNFLERDFPYDQPGKVKKGANCVGRQVVKMDGEEGITLDNVWILNEKVQIDENGKQIPLSQSKYVWQPVGGPCIETVYGKNSSKVDIRSVIHLPLESKNALSNLLMLMKAVLKHNFIAGLYTLASGVVSLHFEVVVDKHGGCPITLLTGKPETGKSTAAKLAIAICGQQHVGHIMKTHSTSDTLCNERLVHSSLPFILDDPKNPDDIGEFLINVYDGALSGNMRKGLRKPRCIPIICCNFTMNTLQRYTSRAMLVPFNLPTVGPTNQQEAETFKQLSQKMTEVSSAVGWAISLGRELSDGRQFDDDRLERVRSKLPGVEPRLCTAYTTALFVVEKILEEANQSLLKEEAEDFLSEILPLIGPTDSSNSQGESTSADVSTVCQSLEALADWAASLKNKGRIHEVLQSMRTGMTCQGKDVIGVCFEDVKQHIPVTQSVIRDCIKVAGLGKHNVSKDFLPLNSTNTIIRRGSNCHSKKCTVVWLEDLPSSLKERLTDVTTPEPQATPQTRNTQIQEATANANGGTLSPANLELQHANVLTPTDNLNVTRTDDLDDLLGDLLSPNPLSDAYDQNSSLSVPTQYDSPSIHQPFHSQPHTSQIVLTSTTITTASPSNPQLSIFPQQRPENITPSELPSITGTMIQQSTSSAQITSFPCMSTVVTSSAFAHLFLPSTSAATQQSASSLHSTSTVITSPPLPQSTLSFSGSSQLPIFLSNMQGSSITSFQSTSYSAATEQSSFSSLPPPTSTVVTLAPLPQASTKPLTSDISQLPIFPSNSNITSFRTSDSVAMQQSSSSSLPPPPTPTVVMSAPLPQSSTKSLTSDNSQLPIFPSNNNVTSFRTSDSATEQSPSSSLPPPTPTVVMSAPLPQSTTTKPLTSDSSQLPIFPSNMQGSNITLFQTSDSAATQQSSSSSLPPPPTPTIAPLPQPSTKRLTSDTSQLPIFPSNMQGSNIMSFQTTSDSAATQQSLSSSLLSPPMPTVVTSTPLPQSTTKSLVTFSINPILPLDTQGSNITPSPASAAIGIPKRQRKRKSSSASPQVPIKRPTRSNTKLPEWNKNLDPDKPLI